MVQFAWISLTRQKVVKLTSGLWDWQELMSRTQRLETSLLFTVMVLSVSEREMGFFAFTSAYDLKQPLPSTSSLLAVYSTCPLTVSTLAHNNGYGSWVVTFQALDYFTTGSYD